MVESGAINCPTCGITIETEGTIWPHFRAPIRGQSRRKRVEGTRDVLQSRLKSEKWRRRHGILRVYPCDQCGRSESDCAAYQHSTEQHVKQLLLDAEVRLREVTIMHIVIALGIIRSDPIRGDGAWQ